MIMFAPFSFSQLKWAKVYSLFGDLPSSVHIYKTKDSLDGKPNIAFFVEANLKDKNLNSQLAQLTSDDYIRQCFMRRMKSH